MSGIRNSCIARGVMAGGTATSVFTVPPEHVLLLKTLLFSLDTAQSGGVAAILREPAGDHYLPRLDLTEQASGVVQDVWVALNAGDQLVVYALTAPVRYWVSGALLPNIPSSSA